MATRNVVLTKEQSNFVDNLVATGRYQNASEAIRAGLHSLEREEAETNQIRKRLIKSLEQARNRQFAEGSAEEVIRRVFAEARKSRAK